MGKVKEPLGTRVRRCLSILVVLILLVWGNKKDKLEEMMEGNFGHISDEGIKQQLEHIFASFPDDMIWIYRDINGDGKEDLLLREDARSMGKERIVGIFTIEKRDVVTILWDVVDMACFYELCDEGVLYYEQYYGVHDKERYLLYRFDESWDKIFVAGLEVICVEDITEMEISCQKLSMSDGVIQGKKITMDEWLEEYQVLFGKEYGGEIINFKENAGIGNLSYENIGKACKENLQDILLKNVWEIGLYEKYISEISGGKSHLVIQIYEEVEMSAIDLGGKEKYYPIYVGEQWKDHRANWEWFYIHEDLNVIYWYDLVDDTLIPLEEWRNSDKYREQAL